MKNMIRVCVVSALLVFIPLAAFAQTTDVFMLIAWAINVLSYIIRILLALAVVVFFWGCVKFILHSDDERQRAEYKQLMVYGLIGIFVMVGFWGIIGYIQSSLGIALPSPSPVNYMPTATIPAAPR